MSQCLAGKRSFPNSTPVVLRFTALSALGLIIAGFSLGQQKTSPELSEQQQIEAAYVKHAKGLRRQLPAYSALPPLLDLRGKKLEDAMCDSAHHVKFETRYNGTMGGMPINDIGVSIPSEATAEGLVTLEEGHLPAIPVRDISSIIIAKTLADRACLAQTHGYIYSRFNIEVLETLKTKRHGLKKGDKAVAVQLGGTIRFPSGFQVTDLLESRGFMEVGKQYVLFMWKPDPADDLYDIVQPYLIRDGHVFPVSASAGNARLYANIPLTAFKSMVKAAIAKNADEDQKPAVHYWHPEIVLPKN